MPIVKLLDEHQLDNAGQVQTGGTWTHSSWPAGFSGPLTLTGDNPTIDITSTTPGDHVFNYVVTSGSCTDDADFTLTVHESPDLTVPSVDTDDLCSVCGTYEVDLTSTVVKKSNSGVWVPGTDGTLSYSWTDSSGTEVSTSDSYTATSADTYTLTVTTSNGCSASQSVEVLPPRGDACAGNNSSIDFKCASPQGGSPVNQTFAMVTTHQNHAANTGVTINTSGSWVVDTIPGGSALITTSGVATPYEDGDAFVNGNATITLLTPGRYEFTYTSTEGNCSDTATMEIKMYSCCEFAGNCYESVTADTETVYAIQYDTSSYINIGTPGFSGAFPVDLSSIADLEALQAAMQSWLDDNGGGMFDYTVSGGNVTFGWYKVCDTFDQLLLNEAGTLTSAISASVCADTLSNVIES